MKFINYIALMLFTLTFLSCRENDSNNIGGDAVLRFTVSQEPILFKQAAAFSHDNTTENLTGERYSSSFSPKKNVNIDSYVEEIDLTKENPLATNNQKYPGDDDNIITELSTPMENGVKYRILVYSKNGNKFLTSVEATSGQEILIPVVKNEEYLWYAYSYNTKESIPAPIEINRPTIPTPIDKELLHASGTASSAGGNTPFTIIFKHQLAQIFVEVDVQRYYGKIESVNASFPETNIVNTGTFDIRSANISDVKSADVTKLDFKIFEPHPYKTRARYYIASPGHLKSFNIRIDQISVIRDRDHVKEDLMNKPSTINFGPYNPARGKQLIATIRVWKSIKKMKILHAQGKTMKVTELTNGGHAAGAGASHNFLKNPNAFGPAKDSKVIVEGFDHLWAYEGNGELAKQLTQNPDIVIFGEEYILNSTDRNALADYVRKGGVLLMFSDFINSGWSAQRELMQNLLGISKLGYGYPAAGIDNQGYKYELLNIDDEVLKGPFGDVRSKYWGADLGRTLYVNTGSNNVIGYSTQSTASRTGGGAPTGFTMFRHKTLNWFWCGDGGFLANHSPNGFPKHNHGGDSKPTGSFDLWGHEGHHLPFATNSNNMPVVYSYGQSSTRKEDIYNSFIFGNVMAWAVERADQNGINSKK